MVSLGCSHAGMAKPCLAEKNNKQRQACDSWVGVVLESKCEEGEELCKDSEYFSVIRQQPRQGADPPKTRFAA